MTTTTDVQSSITIIGRRWFDKNGGNTYFSAQGLVDGEVKETIDFAYGYRDNYHYEMWLALERNGHIPPIERRTREVPGCDPITEISESPWQYCEDRGITLHYSATDVSRKKDL